MSEERFWKMETFQGFCDIFDNDKSICSVRIEYANALIDLLNSLAEENEQLRKELDSFKPVIFQDVRKGTVILYSKGD